MFTMIYANPTELRPGPEGFRSELASVLLVVVAPAGILIVVNTCGFEVLVLPVALLPLALLPLAARVILVLGGCEVLLALVAPLTNWDGS